MTGNIMIVGVGGQGTLLTSRILGTLLLSQGLDVKLSEVHGMSQRGGSVITYVRYGEKVYSPIIEAGQADYVLAFEQLEAARAVGYLRKDGCLLVNTQKLEPMPVITGAMAYPEGLLASMQKRCRTLCVDALSLAEQAGSAKCVNVVMLGVLARQMKFSVDAWTQAIRTTVPEKFLAMNEKAFALGLQYSAE